MGEKEKKEYKSAWYEKNKERLRAKAKKWYQENLDVTKKQRKEYREKNNDKIKKQKKEYWEENKDRFIEKRKKYRDKVMDNFLSYKKGKSCTFCGYNKFPEILQFHHKDDNKLFNISTMRRISDHNLLKKEIEKCILLCPNCHSWLHYQETINKME